MLSLDHITMSYGDRTLFDDVSLTVGPHDRIGLAGSNGQGKSTLLKIIAGLAEADSGTVSKASYVTVGYLPQDGVIAVGKTLLKEVETAFEDVVAVQLELEEVQHQLSSLDPASPEYAEVLEIFGELQHKLEDLDAFRMQSKIEQVLMGLGFGVSDFGRSTEEFSGGWQMRIALAKLLLTEPSVLLLDEPTNHLDIESLQWLEEYLRNYNGAVILVSHDRALLDSLTTKTLLISMGSLEVYAGNYSYYEKERLVRREMTMNAYRNQQKQLEQTQKFIDRFRYKATKARQVQSRIKQIEKLDLIEIEDEEEEIHFRFPPPQSSGVIVMELKDVTKRYGDKIVFSGLEYVIERGDRIAVVGINGAGKSTFVRILAGTEPINAGTRIVGYNVVLSYFAQHQAEELDSSKEVLQVVDEVATGEIRTRLRTILGSFLFHGDDVFKKVSVLSGGEKSRLALAKMLLQPANFLVMDEPTNHLDMRSKGVLQEALASYDGTYVIVSHDRAFLDPLVTKVIELSPGRIRTFPGNVSEYLAKKKTERDGAPAARGTRAQVPVKAVLSEKERKRAEAAQRQALFRKLKPYRDKLAGLEKTIGILEQRKKEIETAMEQPNFFKGGESTKNVVREYEETKVKLEDAYSAWGEVSQTIDRIENGGD